jgi:hypothetical protein
MTNNPSKHTFVPYAKDMLGFWPQLLIVLLALYFAGVVFANTAIGRWILLIPVLMSFVPFIWHVQGVRQSQASEIGLLLTQRFTALALGLGLILLVVSIVWAWRYAFSIFLLPLLALLVYYFGPLAYFNANSSAPGVQSSDLSLFAVLSSLGLLAYTFSYVRAWLSSTQDEPED